ncbi:acetyl-CoA carboxylase carboxyltransferase subunit alpha [Haploplasma axanthum]|uniref:Acetyl-coenzyme A carboxylase carboxyl transferase subunit alpha n=1 Tax=Haploplasma axanthum TaxID=29552 RepID=A0A449BEV6_HAPAX|nr:acetyl-CoA carboxylase carboxyltransferase subunit alpha [Haploplasma axanthum]VEU80981.1 Acetyl-coenzyme A carboxylase carboxyl transferase subunit alpha [Haploplasma axanthum]
MNNAWEKVQLARHANRITTKTLIKEVFPDFLELHGDRLIGDDKAIIAGLGSFNGISLTIIGNEKGVDTKDKINRNFGMAHPEGYHKALRLMKQAEKFNRPILTIIDTPGAYPGVGAEERGQANAIAVNLKEMMQIKVPIITVVLGEGGSGGALAIGVSDYIGMFENSIYSVLSPEGFASISFKDSKKAPEVSEMMKLAASDLLELRVIDEIIPEVEPLSINPKLGIEAFKKFLSNSLNKYQNIEINELLHKRYQKFRNIGVYKVISTEMENNNEEH